MCLAIYVASDHELPTSEWDKDRPAFYLEPLSRAEAVRKRFRYEQVYYAGSHEGCGCGFSKDGLEDDEIDEHQRNYLALGQIVRDALAKDAKIQIFTCWEGSQSAQPESISSITPKILESPEYELKELELLDVHETNA
jgi:hypothetical protein